MSAPAASSLKCADRVGVDRIKEGCFWLKQWMHQTALFIRIRVTDDAARIHFEPVAANDLTPTKYPVFKLGSDSHFGHCTW